MANETHTMKQPAQEANKAEQTRAGFYYRPNVDILEKGDELLVLAEMPGATSDGIDIQFEDGSLTIHGRVEPRHQDVDYTVQEYGVGDYWRTFRIAETIDASKISAEFSDGVLTLHLPKSEAAKPRKISVKG